MKFQSKPTIAGLRKLILIAALVVSPLLAFQTGNAQSVAIATLTLSGTNSITIGSNGTFTLTLGVTTNFVSGGYTVFYESINGQGLFRLIGRTNLNPIFTDPTSLDPFGGMAGLLDPSNQFDLGYTGDQVNNQVPGTFALQSVDVVMLNAPIGTYTIFLDNRSIMVDRTGGGFTDVNMGGASGPIVTIIVVPEPATVGLLVIGGAAVLVVAWCKRRAAA